MNLQRDSCPPSEKSLGEIPASTRLGTLIGVHRSSSIYRVGGLRCCKRVDAVREKMESRGRCKKDKEVVCRD